MRKALIALIVIALLGFGLWSLLGGVEEYGAARVEEELVARGVPQPVAACMGERMADRLSPNQLRKLERLAPAKGESAVPMSPRDILARVQRIDDPEVVEVAISAATVCALSYG